MRNTDGPGPIGLFVYIALSGAAFETNLLAVSLMVDAAAPGSSDLNPGTEAAPVQTIQRAADLSKPGDTIFVMAGKYNERVHIQKSGAQSQEILFKAVPRRTVVVEGFDIRADYVRVEGFEVTAQKPAVAFQLDASHCEVLDNYVHDMMVGVAGTVGKMDANGKTRNYAGVSHNHIAYNKIYHSEYGFMLGGNDWLVENNEVNRLFMFAPGNKYDDCDYSRFFGKGCIERFNYYHGSTASESRVAHVDCLQTFTVNDEIAQDLLFEYNTCFDFHQMCMVESAPHIGSVRNWTFRHNIVSADSPTMSGGWGPDIIQTPDVTIANNTISTVRWAAIGLRGAESLRGHIFNNILCNAERAVIDGDGDFSTSSPIIEYNLTFATSPAPGPGNINGSDPLFVDSTLRNFRIRKGSPAIGAGKSGVTIGALNYPNVYFVDPSHPAASDEPAWGYPAVPLISLTKACSIAKSGETVVLRGGVYRELLRPQNNDVTIRAMKGEKVFISGADIIEGWQREAVSKWSAPLHSPPKRLLRDGLAFTEFAFDSSRQRLIVQETDPRLHLFENVVRASGIDISRKTGVRIQGISVVNVALEKEK